MMKYMMKYMNRKRFLLAAAVCALTLSGCGNSENNVSADSGSVSRTEAEESAGEAQIAGEADPAVRDVFAMDTYMTVTAYGDRAEEAVEAAVEEIERLDAILSTGDENSEVAAVNKNGGGVLSSDTAYLLERSLELNEMTDGKFDITIYPVMEAWGFTTQEYSVPSEDTLQELLSLVDSGGVVYNEENSEVSFEREGMMIDFGGIAKGYTSSRIMDIYREYGVVSGMVSLGGNVQLMGTKTDGSFWRVAIQSPDEEDGYIGVLEAADVAVITSGGYERYFEQDGVTYHHIIDPDTGYPADNGLVSVTIVSADGALADGLSTSLFIMGLDEASDFWRAHSEEFDTILMDESGTVYVTEGIADRFQSDYEVQIIREDE